MEQIVRDAFQNRFKLGALHQPNIGFWVRHGRLIQNSGHRNDLPRQHRGAPTKARRQRHFGIELLPQRVANNLIKGPVKITPSVQEIFRDRQGLIQPRPERCFNRLNISHHFGIRRQQIGKNRQQTVLITTQASQPKLKVQHAQKLAIGASIGHHAHAARIGNRYRHGYGIVGMPAEDKVDSRDSAGQL